MIDSELIQQVALLLAIGLGSGVNVYLTMLMLGIGSMTGNYTLPTELEFLANPLIIALAGIMYIAEFGVDKVPGLDSVWDSIHTFIRIPMGAVLGADVFAESMILGETIGAITGGALATSTHVVKSGSRAMINTSPEPFSNWTASVSEDVAVFTALWAALNHPVVWIGVAIICIIIIVWVVPKLWRGIKFIVRKISSLFSKSARGT